jgi:ribosomal protein S20
MTDIIDIVVRDSGTPVVVRNLENVGTAASKSSKEVDLLRSAMGALAGALAVGKLMEWADTWNSAMGSVRVNTRSLDEARIVMDKIFDAAQKTRTPLTLMANLYNRTAIAATALGASQADIIKFSTGVGEALAIQHTSAQQATGTLLELGEAVGQQTVRAQQYNALLKNGVVILQTVAANMEGGAISVAKLTDEVHHGHVTSKEFFEAFLRGADSLEGKFQKTSFLFSQAFTVLNNAVAEFIGKLNESLGASDGFVSFVKWVAANLPIIGPIILGIGVAIATAFSVQKIFQFAAALQALWGLMLANPFTAVLAILAGVISALYLMKDVVISGLDDTTTYGDLMLSIWQGLKEAIISTWEVIPQVFHALVDGAKSAFSSVAEVTASAADTMESDWSDFFTTTHSGFLGMLEGAAKVIDAIIGLLGGMVLFGIRGVQQFVDMTVLLLKVAANAYIGFVQDSINAVIGASNALREKVGLDKFNLVTLPKAQIDKGAAQFKDVGTLWAESMDDAFSATDAMGLQAWLAGRVQVAQDIAKNRPKLGGEDLSIPVGIADNPSDSKGAAKAARELAKLKEALSRVIAEINPMEAAMKRLTDAQDVLDKAVAHHLITQGEANTIMDRLRQKYAEILDPLKTMTDEIERQQGWMKLSNDQARIEQDLYTRSEELKRKGIFLTQAETDALRAKLVVSQELDRIAQARDTMEKSSSAGKDKDFKAQLEALKELLSGPNFKAGDVSGALSAMLPWADLSKTKEQMNSYVQAYADMLAQIKALEDAGVVSHQTSEMLKRQIDVQYMEQRLSAQRSFFSTLAGLSSSSNKKLAAIGKAAAITTAIIDGVVAVQKAYAGSPYPYNIAAAVAQGIISAANVAAIMSQNTGGFRTGGDFIVGGRGGDDSQMVAFRATPGERVTVNTPTQARALEQGSSQGPQVVNIKNVNVLDKAIVGDFMESPEGEILVLNVLAKNGITGR